MNKKLLIIGAVVLILLIGGGVAFMQLNKPKTTEDQAATSNNQTETTDQSSTTKGSIQSLLSAGKNVSCELNYPDGKGKGMVLVSGNKVRGDFTVQVETKEMISHMISDGSFMYMWTDGMAQGTKMKIDPNAPKPSVSPGTQTQATDLEKEVDLKCNPWNVDNSKFTVPDDIKFTDMTQSLNNMKNMDAGMPKMDKSLCDQITDPNSKAACLKAIGN